MKYASGSVCPIHKPNPLLGLYPIFTFSLYSLYLIFPFNGYLTLENKERRLKANIELEGGITMKTIFAIVITLLLIMIGSQKVISVQKEVKSDMSKIGR